MSRLAVSQVETGIRSQYTPNEPCAASPGDHTSSLRQAKGSASGDPTVTLTPREREVLNLLAEGATNKGIARRLDISVHTAKFHVAAIQTKLDATGRTDTVAQAVRLGLIML